MKIIKMIKTIYVNKKIKIILKNLILFLFGGFIYFFLEIIYRGYSHWAMYILGGICFLFIGYINKFLPWKTPLILQMLIGCLIITTLELITGIVVNIWLKLNVWDYSKLNYNFLGQISIYSSICWYFISFVAIILDDYLRYFLFNEQKPVYKFI